jgi:MFS transporter, ACDE family, multidrug resistance protein
LAAVEAVMALQVANLTALITCIVLAGFLLGLMNTVLTESAMEVTDLPRSVASSTYSGVRFVGGAVAPAVAGTLAAAWGAPTPYWLGVAALVVSAVVVVATWSLLRRIDSAPEETTVEEAAVLTAADA